MIPPRLIAGVKADLSANRQEHVFRLQHAVDRALQRLLNDPRDLPVAVLLLNILLTAVPGAILVIYWGIHLGGAVFLACNYSVYLQRYLVALLHVAEHRPLFRKGQGSPSPCGTIPSYTVLHHTNLNHATEHAIYTAQAPVLIMYFNHIQLEHTSPWDQLFGTSTVCHTIPFLIRRPTRTSSQ